MLYDDRGRQNETIEPTGTIDITVFDPLGRVASKWVGTNATPGANGDDWEPDNQGTGSNMMDVEDDSYNDTMPSTPPVPDAPSLTNYGHQDYITDGPATYYVKITYTGPGGESQFSSESSLFVANQDALVVNSPAAASGATGWNVYVSTTSGQEVLQNTSGPMSIGSNWTENFSGGVSTVGRTDPMLSNTTDGGNAAATLSQVTTHPGLGQPDRVTQFLDDWRNRQVAQKDGIQATETDGAHRPILYTIYDNLNEPTASFQYDGDGIPLSDFASTAANDSAPTADSSALRAKSTSSYDDQGRVYRSQVYSVDQSTGAIGNSLTTNTFFDHRGNAIAVFSPGGQVAKSVYDGAGRLSSQYVTDGGAVNNAGVQQMDWSHAGSVSSDVVLTENDYTYDGDGNVILTTTRDRFDNDSTASTGALGSPTSGIGARVYYLGDYYDAADRLITEVNAGTNGGTAWTRPSSSTDPSISRSSTSTVLRTDFAYDVAGNQYLITDPRGILTQFNFDLLGRKDQEIDDSTGGSPATGKNVTNFTYDGDNNILTMQAYQPNGTTSPSQTTAYLYGVGGTAGTNLFSNDLLSKVEYPDPTTGNAGTAASDDVLTTYDLLGEALTQTDQNQTTHTFSRDILGRLTLDAVTTLASGVDGSVRALGYTYSPLGQPYQQTSYSDAAGTTVVNQIQESYNGYGQLTAQYQAVSGAVNTTSTPVTQYTYSQPSGANYSRLSSMTYPNGRVLDYVYNSGLDSDISRVSALADDSGSGVGNLQSYTYLGLDTIVQEADANGVALSYIQQPGDTLVSSDGGDQYTGLDRFGRVIDQNYVNTSTGVSTDRFQFAYDRNSNALYENNLLNSSFSELFHANSAASGDDATAYDGLNRLTGFERGTLSASGNNGSTLDTVSSPTGFFNSQSWNYDSIGNITSDTGARYGSETRTANSQNELTQLKGTVTLNPTYDSNGNMIGDGLGYTFIYDAWNRPVTAKENGSVVYSYGYMANLNMGASTDTNNFTTTDFYYSADGHELEDRNGITVTAQYVWGLGATQNLVLRDDNSLSGSFGKTGSGLGERIFVQHDVNFNVTALTDTSGNVLERWVYAPYGMSNAYTASWGGGGDSYDWVYTFQMGRVERYLGIKFGARTYDPALQVWMQADPAQYVNGLDRYQLDLSNPASYTDPSGFYAVAAAGGGYIVGGGSVPLSNSGQSMSPDPILSDPDYRGAQRQADIEAGVVPEAYGLGTYGAPFSDFTSAYNFIEAQAKALAAKGGRCCTYNITSAPVKHWWGSIRSYNRTIQAIVTLWPNNVEPAYEGWAEAFYPVRSIAKFWHWDSVSQEIDDWKFVIQVTCGNKSFSITQDKWVAAPGTTLHKGSNFFKGIYRGAAGGPPPAGKIGGWFTPPPPVSVP